MNADLLKPNRSALILAAHGSDVAPDANALVREYTEQLSGMGLFDEVAAAFQKGEPVCAAVLDETAADEFTVVPVMTSEGYFTDVVLRRELARNRCYARVSLRQTPPVGIHPDIIPLISRRVRDRLEEYGLNPADTSLAVVGHGTARHRRSRIATCQHAVALERLDLCYEVLPAFLDECPGVQSIPNLARRPNVIVVPFLVGCGPHATRDIPIRLGLTIADDASPPFTGYIGHRFIVCDAAVGTDPGIVRIIARLARPEAAFSWRLLDE